MKSVAGLLLTIMMSCVIAQPASPDSLARDSLRTRAETPDGDSPRFRADAKPNQGQSPRSAYRPARSPGTAVLLSALLPGGGQVYTGNWWKAALVAPAEVTLGYFAYKAHMDASAALGRGDSTYIGLRDRRTALLWWTGAVIVLSMTDAYVSAQMFGFDREMSLALGPGRVGIRMGL